VENAVRKFHLPDETGILFVLLIVLVVLRSPATTRARQPLTRHDTTNMEEAA